MRKSETYRNEIKSYIVRAGMTMTEVVDYLSDEYGWSRSVPNLSGKLRRGSLRYGEAVELADALGYDIVWQKRKHSQKTPFCPTKNPSPLDTTPPLVDNETE